MIKKIQKENRGFTIIETMIAVSLFSVVILYGMNALFSINLLEKKSQGMRSIMDNLSFAMEEMGRNLRTGYDYHCINDGNLLNTSPESCEFGSGISFKTSGGAQWVYNISGGALVKSVDGGSSLITLTSPEIVVDSFSGFSVLGAELEDDSQPLVRIKLEGEIKDSGVDTPFSLQTSISERTPDIIIP